MLRLTLLIAATLSTTACASRIELPGTVLPPEEAVVTVEGMGGPVEWRPADASTGQIADAAGLQLLGEDFPDSSSVALRRMIFRFRQEDWKAVAAHAEWLLGRSYRLSDGAIGQIEGNIEPDAHRELVTLAATFDAEVVFNWSASSSVAEIPSAIALPESVLWDESNGRLFVTGIVSRGLFLQEKGDDWREVPLAGAGSLAGIALDAPRGLMWVGSGVVDPTPDPETAFRGVIAIDRITLEERRRVLAPEGVSISDIAVGPDGTVYGSDPVGGGVYAAAPGGSVMQTFIAPGTFRSPQGIAVRPDNSALYISDYRYGLAQVMLRSRAVYRMRAAEPMLLDGVDGLWLRGNELIAVQNGLAPHRITAFELGQGVGVIASHRVLEIANPAWTEPLGGSVSGDSLYYIANGQWDIWGEGGVLNEGASTRTTNIHHLPLAQTAEEQP